MNIVFNWSSGKDSALALQNLMADPEAEVRLLLTTVSEPYRRVSQHGVRVELLEAQAASLGLPLLKVWLPEHPDMETYGNRMSEALGLAREQGMDTAAFGDIFLEDLRAYREQKLASAGFETVFPLWKEDTRSLAERFIEEGFRARIVCINGQYLDPSFAGREFNDALLDDLPDTVDPCGENGEFHTFVYDGPLFNEPLPIEAGEVVSRSVQAPVDDTSDRDGYRCDSDSEGGRGRNMTYEFWFCDLLLRSNR